MNTPKASEMLFQEFVAKAGHAKSKRTIENIKGACDYLDEKGIGISISEVGKLCKKTGPAVQSIRNNKSYRSYVLTRASEQSRTPSKRIKESIPLRTGNPQWDAEIEALEATLRFKKKEFKQLKSAVENVGEYDIQKSITSGKLVLSSPTTPDYSDIYDDALQTIERIFDSENLERFGLESVNGRVISPERNEAVFITKIDLARIQKAIDLSHSKLNGLPDGD